MIGIYTFKAGKGLKVENEGYLVAGAVSFWIMSFFKKSYESALGRFHSYSTSHTQTSFMLDDWTSKDLDNVIFNHLNWN